MRSRLSHCHATCEYQDHISQSPWTLRLHLCQILATLIQDCWCNCILHQCQVTLHCFFLPFIATTIAALLQLPFTLSDSAVAFPSISDHISAGGTCWNHTSQIQMAPRCKDGDTSGLHLLAQAQLISRLSTAMYHQPMVAARISFESLLDFSCNTALYLY